MTLQRFDTLPRNQYRLVIADCDAAMEINSHPFHCLSSIQVNQPYLHQGELKLLTDERAGDCCASERQRQSTWLGCRRPCTKHPQIESINIVRLPKSYLSVLILNGIGKFLDLKSYRSYDLNLIKRNIKAIIVGNLNDNVRITAIALYLSTVHVKIWIKIAQTDSDLPFGCFDLLLHGYPCGRRSYPSDKSADQRLIAVQPELDTSAKARRQDLSFIAGRQTAGPSSPIECRQTESGGYGTEHCQRQQRPRLRHQVHSPRPHRSQSGRPARHNLNNTPAE